MKKLITLICLMLIVSMDSMAGTKTIFMKPNSNWIKDGAIFKLYMYNGSGHAWVNFSAVDGDEEYYQATFDDQYTSMILVRYNPTGTAPNPWDDAWNQSNDLDAPASDNLLYTIPDGEWSNFAPTVTNYFATITQVDFRSSFNGWGDDDAIVFESTSTTDSIYTSVINLATTTANIEFKVKVNKNLWIGVGNATLVDEGSLIDISQGEGNNFILKNSNKTYKTYTITVKWTPSRVLTNDNANWKITVAGKDARGSEAKSVTYVDGHGWENVYAYIYPDADYTGWPGTDITSEKSTTTIGEVTYNVYTFNYNVYEGGTAPTKIVFNDGTTVEPKEGINKTPDLALVAGKQYKYGLPAGQYVLAGDNTDIFPNKWDAESSTQVLTNNGDGTYSYSIKDVALAANASFGFKVVDIANSALVWYPASNVTYTVKDAATYDFDITFDTNPETPTVGVTGKRQVVIDAAGFTSFSSGHDLDWSAVENAAPYMATLTGEAGYRKALLSKVTATEAGQGALIKGTPNATVKPIIKDVTNSFEGNLFVATNGTAISASTDGSYNYVYSSKDKLGNDNPGFYKLTSGLVAEKVKANGAYLQTTEPLAEEAASRVSWIFDDEVTGINQIENTQPATVKNTVVYNLNGQRVMNPAKGLYIVNGKKVIIK